MGPDEGAHPLPLFVGKPQPGQQPLGQLLAQPRVAVKVGHPIGGEELRPGLPAVVEERRPPQGGILGGVPQGVEGVLPHGVAVVGGLLGAAAHGHKLRQQGEDDPAVLPQHLGGPFPAEELRQLLPHPLRREPRQQPLVLPQSPGRALFDGKPQHRGEPQTPQHPQGVLG